MVYVHNSLFESRYVYSSMDKTSDLEYFAPLASFTSRKTRSSFVVGSGRHKCDNSDR
jgi:hypothetical protein